MISEIELTLCTLNYYTSDYIIYQDKIVRLLDNTPFRRVILDTSERSEIGKLKDLPNTEVYRKVFPKHLAFSQAHGYGMNLLMEKIKTKYAILIDPDFLILMKDWAKKIIKLLKDKYDIIGTPYNPLHKRRRIQNVPNAIFFAFKVEKLKSISPDWRPLNVVLRRILYKIFYYFPKLNIFDFEMGYKVLKKIKRKGFRILTFEFIQPWDERSVFKFKVPYDGDVNNINPALVLYPEEYHLNGVLFGTHQRRTKFPFNKHPYSKKWKEAIDKYLAGQFKIDVGKLC